MLIEQRFNIVGEDENLPIDYTQPLESGLEAAGICMSAWGKELGPDAPRDRRKNQATISVKYLQIADFTGLESVFDLVRELRKVGPPATIREIIGAMANSHVLKVLLKLDPDKVTRFRGGDVNAVIISSIPAMGTLQEDGKEVPAVCRYAHTEEWGLIPSVAWTTAHPVAGRQCLFVVVTSRNT